jgi:phospholipid/cholesterol/gamma-HCH transport system permease protein
VVQHAAVPALESNASTQLSFSRPASDTLQISLAGAWEMQAGVPRVDAVQEAIESEPRPRQVSFDTGALRGWDSGLLTFLVKVGELCAERGIKADRAGLPDGVRRLLDLAEAVPERKGARSSEAAPSLLARIGMGALAALDEAQGFLAFLGQTALAFWALLRGRARLRLSDLFLYMQQAGAEALPIITLISFLVGVIMAFVGAVQLQKFGAAIYVADLVGIAVVREMGAMMTGIVMAGRTGAAFAAQLGTMKVTQEIDALTTMGIAPMEFLVLPRALALCLMMPLLCLYSDLIGILGGAAIATGMLGLSLPVYFTELFHAVTLTDLAGGIFKASVYGVLIAIAGCLRGMESGSSASAVGDAATSAVVTGIVLIISACGLFAVVFYVLGI